MATKDWKQIDYSRNHNSWNHRKAMKSIDVYQLSNFSKIYGNNTGQWEVSLQHSGSAAYANRLGLFKTKKQALAFAKSYMRKH